MGCTPLLLRIPLLIMVIISAANCIQTTSSSDYDCEPSDYNDYDYEPDILGTDSIHVSKSDSTVRVDPLNNFKKYRGGYGITNKHYWSSAVFTGFYGYAIGILWLLFGLVCGGCLLATTSCSKRTQKPKRKSTCFKQCNFWTMLLAITASGLVLGGNARFYSQAKTAVNIIIHTANEASETIYNATGVMKEIRDNLGVIIFIADVSEASDFLKEASEGLDVEAADIQRQARHNRHLINKGLDVVYVITTLTISLNLIAVIALSVFGLLRFQRTLYLLIAVCWFLTVLCWFCSGMYFFLENFSSDSCTALESFQENPDNNSLSSILSCNELHSAESVLYDVSVGIYNIVNKLNEGVSALRETYLNIPYICNPFSAPPEYAYQPSNCSANTIKIGDIPKILAAFTCSDGNGGICRDGEFISSSDYRTVEALTSTIQSLLNAYPGMESLVECQSVNDAFSEILVKHCKPLKRFLRMGWTAMVLLATIMVVLLLIWTALTRHEQELHLSDVSVELGPQSATAGAMASQQREGGRDHPNSNSVYRLHFWKRNAQSTSTTAATAYAL